MQQTRFFKAVGVSNHRRVDGRAGRWRELNRFEFLVTLLAGLLLPGGSTARDVPFAAAAVIDPFQVQNAFPKDVDGDGDLDVVSLRFDGAWQVVWEENTGGDASSWSPHVIDAFASSLETPEKIFPADLDRDGDLDVVSLWKDTFPSTQKVIGWHENTAGDGSAWVRHVIFGAISPARWR